jgi:hypothetical protein
VTGEDWLQRESVRLHRKQRADDARNEGAGAANNVAAL